MSCPRAVIFLLCAAGLAAFAGPAEAQLSQAPGAAWAMPMPLPPLTAPPGARVTTGDAGQVSFDQLDRGVPGALPAGYASAASPTPAPSPKATPPVSPSPDANMMNQMLDEAGGSGAPNPRHLGFRQADCGGPICAGEGDPCFEPLWYFSAAGLVMTRDRGNRVWTTAESGVAGSRLMHTQDADADWQGGYEIRLGRRFCGGRWAVEAAYWSINGWTGTDGRLTPSPGSLDTLLGIADLEFGGAAAGTLLNNALEHRLRRHDEVDSVEVSLLRSRLGPGEGLLEVNWSMGARYFRFHEALSLASLVDGGDGWGGSGLDEAYLRDRITNNLAGFQFGLDACWYLGYNLRLSAAPKMALCNNHVTHRLEVYRGDGLPASPSAASGFAGTFPVASSDDVFSFLGQIDVELAWEFHPQWTAFLGYRFLAATGIGLADQQLAPSLADLPELASIDHNGHVIVHGGFAGLRVRF